MGATSSSYRYRYLSGAALQATSTASHHARDSLADSAVAMRVIFVGHSLRSDGGDPMRGTL
jgi:hypothetical protein